MSYSPLIYLWAVLFGLYSLLKSDPLKASLGLLGVVISSACYMSPWGPSYLPYYLVLLLLSGVLVVVVTITAISKFKVGHRSGVLAFLLGVLVSPSAPFVFDTGDSLFEICSWGYLSSSLLLFFILLLILFFMKVMMNSKGALRKF